MKRLGCWILGMAFCPLAWAQAPAPPTTLDQEIRQELNALEQAVIQRDAAAIDRLVANDYTFTQPDTEVSGKKELLEEAKSESGFTYVEHRIAEIMVRGYGITAVSTGRFMVAGKYKGQLITHPVQFTAVHVRQDGRWQLVALHSTIKPEGK